MDNLVLEGLLLNAFNLCTFSFARIRKLKTLSDIAV